MPEPIPTEPIPTEPIPTEPIPTESIPIVDYLVIDDEQFYLRAHECGACHALFLDRRNACAGCGGRDFTPRRLGTTGTLRSYTVIHRAAPGVPVPYASLLVDLDGGGVVKGNLLGAEPRPELLGAGLRVRLGTWIAGEDEQGTRAVAFGFTPVAGPEGDDGVG